MEGTAILITIRSDEYTLAYLAIICYVDGIQTTSKIISAIEMQPPANILQKHEFCTRGNDIWFEWHPWGMKK